LSSLVDFEDLGELDGADLRAVLDQVTETQALEALAGTSLGFRQRLLTKLPGRTADLLAARLDAFGPVPYEAARSAQRAVVDALCRLSRGGQVAFDDPADMVA
jgi:flagellar motor switch protein FliG